MKFFANVEVNHRATASYSMPKRRSQRSSLAFGTKPGNSDELILVHRTVQNSVGTTYKVKGNVDKVFDKYVKEGKMTIRFKEPPHDLIINGEASTLEKFILTLKMALGRKVPLKSLKLPVVGSEPLKKIPPKPKQNIEITSKSEYPNVKGFPNSAVSIMICGLQETKFDMRLLGLPHLKVLDLSDNQLSEMPLELDLITSLEALYLTNNRMGDGDSSDWTWLRGKRLSRQLQFLDLSGNELTFLHPSVCNLRALRTLKIENNKIKTLPDAIGTLNHLRKLVAKENQLSFLPASTLLLKLWHLDVTDNLFVGRYQNPIYMERVVPSLMESAARCVVNNRLRFGPEDLPLDVQQYLDTVSFCHCRKACFESGIYVFSSVNINSLAENVIREIGDMKYLPVRLKLCSFQCTKDFNTLNNKS